MRNGRSGYHAIFTAAAVGALAVGVLSGIPGQEAEAGSSCLPGILKTRLEQIRKNFGSVEIISTYRAGARMPNGNTSYHASCRAVDFNPPRGKYSNVANWLKSNHDGGVGTYSCGMHHIHIDNGPRVRFHHCQSAGAVIEGGPDAVRAARAAMPVAGSKGAWPVVLPEAKPRG
ncbi:MAG: D-Ala-D-Ala carboxypeptidase family metallohydrolase [Hyphomicrobiaceae bacterium]